MAALPATALLLFLVAPSVAQIAVTEPIRAVGTVELSAADATRTAEIATIETLVERFSPRWQGRASWMVPSQRIDSELRAWMHRDFARLPSIEAEPLEVRDTTAGKAYRQAYELDLTGRDAHRLQVTGDRVVKKLNRLFRKRLAVIAGVWVALLFACLRLDRVTRGYLTGRIRVGALVLALLTAFLVYP